MNLAKEIENAFDKGYLAGKAAGLAMAAQFMVDFANSNVKTFRTGVGELTPTGPARKGETGVEGKE